ncbi:MAG: adenylate/guanylate cyclase domain-containing protein [Gammaproteobacteria bacterium]|nr:adenylate/guanylate cyclase domain-containing protein [Gammaproteobacteria bacterium]MBU1625379.1 adenylate/guanylate cyclase domain-containing protein [Gammaproteobacteria bacterium]MBU1981639.1 adenylate/guanylate cyclase domain-containing protein [Gammaproteobacteria bacterium]
MQSGLAGGRMAQHIDTQQIDPEVLDTQEDKLRKSLLIFAAAFMTFAVMFWLAIYWMMGLNFSSNVPLVYQIISVGSLVYYMKTRNFEVLRFVQLNLFLFAPFVMQWSIGSSITSSGVALWALLAPIGALVVSSWKESVPWFVAYMVLTAVSGFFDFYLGTGSTTGIPLNTIGFFFALNFAAMSAILYFLVRYFVIETEKIKHQLDEQHALLAEEQKKSERVLFNVLPSSIAERLKRNEGLIADGYADVTVMFADLVNFTQLTEQMSPEQMVGLLNTVFSGFDELSEKYGLEKIKTIGDAYMVVGGLTRERPDYAADVVNMGMEMIDFVNKHPLAAKRNLGVHVGIATGPVVAGVIGTKRFIYDLWGDTVNIASRLTDDAKSGHILTDRLTYNRLRHEYLFEPPNVLNVKGKGEMTSYRLVGRADSLAEAGKNNIFKLPPQGESPAVAS